MLIYDVDKIEDLYQDFEKCQKDFKNKEYDDFRSSYFYNCSDSVIVKLRNRIQTIYDNIKKGYDMIDKVWKEYIDDVGNFDKSIASGGNCGIHDGGVSSIVSKICSIELYDSAGVSTAFKSIAASGKNIGKSILNALKRTGASILNTVFSILFGLAKFVESIFDAVVLIVGGVIGVVVAALDGVTSLFSKDKDGFGVTKKYFNGLLKFIGKDGVGFLKTKLYGSTRFGKWLEKNAYSPFKSDGLAFSIGEGLGYVVGVIIVTVISCGIAGAASGAASAAAGGASAAASGASTAATASTQLISGVVAGAGALGKATQSGYNSTVDKVVQEAAEKGVTIDKNDVELDAKQMAKIVGNSTAQGVIEGVTFGLTYGGGIKATGVGKKLVEKGANTLLNPATKVVKTVGKEVTEKAIKDSAKSLAAKTSEIVGKAGIQAGKEFAKAGSDEFFDIKDHTADEVIKNAAVSASVSVLYDVSGVGEKVLRVTSDKISGVSGKAQEKLNEALATNGVSKGGTLIAEGLDDVDDSVSQAVAQASKKEIKEMYNGILKSERAIYEKTNPLAYELLYPGGKKIIGTPIKTAMKKGEEKIMDTAVEFLEEVA